MMWLVKIIQDGKVLGEERFNTPDGARCWANQYLRTNRLKDCTVSIKLSN
jgi:hypothetical protein